MISNQDNWNNISLINQSQVKLKALSSNINEYDNLDKLYGEYHDFVDIYDSLNELEKNELIENLKLLEKSLNKLKIQSLLNGKTDDNNCFIEIHAGAGGTESQDWADMLLRMYQRFAEKYDYKFSLIDYQKGEEAGIKNATLLLSGYKPYGYLKKSLAYIGL